MYREQKIASFQQGKDKLQLLKLTEIGTDGIETDYNKYQVRLNRKRISTSIDEYNERKVFATYAQNIILQLKIY